MAFKLASKWSQTVALYPWLTLFAAWTCSAGLIVCVLLVSSLPSFDEPLLGFEGRGTDLGNKINAWRLISESTSWGGDLTLYPYASREALGVEQMKAPGLDPRVRANHGEDGEDEEEEEKRRLANAYPKESASVRKKTHFGKTGTMFCNDLSDNYAHFVLESDLDMFSVKQMHAICELDQMVRLEDSKTLTSQRKLFENNCELKDRESCCSSWSLPNYVALAGNKSSCFQLNARDIQELCPDVPEKCFQYNNLVYNAMHFLLEDNFLSVNSSGEKEHLKRTSLYLPIAKSAALLDYYRALSERSLNSEGVKVVAMDLGIKHALFESLLLSDSKYLALAFFVIFVSLWSYTSSLFIVGIILCTLFASLGISYFIYSIVFRISFFPFMNLMTVVILIGIGSDTALVYCSVWESAAEDNPDEPIDCKVRRALRLTVLPTSVASLTTAGAFFASYVTNITAIKCFSVFAGTTVLVNFVLTIICLPPALVISQRSPNLLNLPTFTSFTAKCGQLLVKLSKACFELLFRSKYVVCLILATFGVVCMTIVKNNLQLPDSSEFQTFRGDHPFERYDLIYKHSFRSSHDKNALSVDHDSKTLPIIAVFGVKPVDTGSHLNPFDRGSLVFDEDFDISEPSAQLWLLNFCQRLRNESFYQPTSGPMLSNCFIETLKSWIDERSCFDPIDNSSQSPCCRTSQFPFERQVLTSCLTKAVQLLHRTPTYVISQYAPGPRFSKSTLRTAVAIFEYPTNYSYTTSFPQMDLFWQTINGWLNSQLNESVPNGLRSGWLVSNNLHLFALQDALFGGTMLSIILAIAFAFISIVVTTRNLILTVSAILSVSFIIFTTIGVLILFEWKLNVLESVAVSSSVGMAVDLTLHFAIAYKYHMNTKETRCEVVRSTLSSVVKPLTMAALTSFLAGLAMIPSQILAYFRIGYFLMTISVLNWVYSIIFLMCSLLIVGPQRSSNTLRLCPKRSKSSTDLEIENLRSDNERNNE